MSEPRSALVIGGGIIGINAAIYLAEAGFAVTVFDRTGICEETSSGHAAALAVSDIVPMAHKGFMGKVPGWLADPLGPLTIRPNYALTILPWLLRVAREGQAGKRAAAVAAQAAMMRLSAAETEGVVARAGIGRMIRREGSLELYKSEAVFRQSQPGWALREEHGIPFEHVRGGRLRELQPGLSAEVVAATYSPNWKTVSDSKGFGKALWAYAERLGCRFIHAEIAVLRADQEAVHVIAKGGQSFSAPCGVLCAGAWSHLLARQIGEAIPLETERGYNTTLPKTAFDVKRMLIFSADGFVLTPLENAVRVGGAVEFGGLANPPNYKRAAAMLKKAKTYLPGLDTSGGRQWMGFRPTLPDTLPAIGRSKASPRLIFAFGHGHLGLTQSAAAGRLVRDLALGDRPALDLTPFSPQRFG